MNIERKTIKKDEEYLRQVSARVFEDDPIDEYIKMLKEFCKETECYALAANQIGIQKRIIYLKNTTQDIPLENINYDEEKIIINPLVLSKKGKTKYWEPCLSCLDITGLVTRPHEIELLYFDQYGNEHIETFTGFQATILSHELDHLDGVLHIDIAEEIKNMKNMKKEERIEFRKLHPYEIISKEEPAKKIVKR